MCTEQILHAAVLSLSVFSAVVFRQEMDIPILVISWANGNKQYIDGASVTIEGLLAGDGQSAPPSHFEYDFNGGVVQFDSQFGLKMALQHLQQMQQINLVEAQNGLQLRAIARTLPPSTPAPKPNEPAANAER
eukprot:COSAG02_NODE_30678_length_547_cov_0.781250_2_plen_132_part_01